MPVSGFQKENISIPASPEKGGGGTNIDIDQPLKGVPEQEAQLNKLKLAFMVLKFVKAEGFNSPSTPGTLKLQASTWLLSLSSTVPVKAASPLMLCRQVPTQGE